MDPDTRELVILKRNLEFQCILISVYWQPSNYVSLPLLHHKAEFLEISSRRRALRKIFRTESGPLP